MVSVCVPDLDRDVVRLEVDVAVQSVDAVGRHEPARPVGRVVVVPLGDGGQPLHTVIGIHRVGENCSCAKGHRHGTGRPNHVLHFMFLSSVDFSFERDLEMIPYPPSLRKDEHGFVVLQRARRPLSQ